MIRTGAAIAGALALASAAAAQPSMPVARATDADRLLVGLADEAAGEAIVTLRHDEASNAPTCKAGSVRGGQAIAAVGQDQLVRATGKALSIRRAPVGVMGDERAHLVRLGA